MGQAAYVSGILTVGTIAFDGYGFTVRPKDWWNHGDSQFDITASNGVSSVEELSSWAKALNIAYNNKTALDDYPKHCKLYVDNELVYIGDRFYMDTMAAIKTVTYTRSPGWDKPDNYILNKKNLHKALNVTLELYD